MPGIIVATWAGQRAQRQKQETARKDRERDEAWALDGGRLEGDEIRGMEEEQKDIEGEGRDEEVHDLQT